MERKNYDLTNPADRETLHNYFKNYQPYNFHYRGWQCWIISSPIGNLNGYVELDEQFCDWMKENEHFETLSIHGGITWEGGALAVPETNDAYVIGFDTAHLMDITAMDIDPLFNRLRSPRYDILNERRLWLQPEVEEELTRLVDQLAELHDIYRRENYVR